MQSDNRPEQPQDGSITPVSPPRRLVPFMTPQGDSLHQNFLQSARDLKRDMVRVVYYLEMIRSQRIHLALGFDSIEAYAARTAGFTHAQTRRFVQLGRQLAAFPLVSEALMNGELSFSKAQLICSRTTPEQQQAMIDLARGLTTRRLRDQLDLALASPEAPDTQLDRPAALPSVEQDAPSTNSPAAPDATPPASSQPTDVPAPAALDPEPSTPVVPAPTPPTSPAFPRLPSDTPQHVSLRLTPDQYQAWSNLLDHLRRRTRDDNASLVLAGLQALATGAADPKTATPTGPPFLVVLLQCPDCGQATIPIRDGEAMAPDSLLASSRCDAIVESADGGRRSVIPPRMRALAFKRARWRCEAPNCTRHRLLEVHHRTLVAVGGINRLDNLIVLC